MISALSDLENALRQLHTYIGVPLSPAEKLVAEKIYGKALQKLEQSKLQQDKEILSKLDALDEKLNILADFDSTLLIEIRERRKVHV